MIMVLVAVLAFVTIAGLGFVFAGGDSGNARAAKRAQALVSGGPAASRVRNAKAAANSPEARRKAILKTLKDQDRQQKKATLSIAARLQQAGLIISAITQREKLTEIVELPQSEHPWFVGVQFHPEFKSTPWDGHPLFISYIKAALARHTASDTVKKVAA